MATDEDERRMSVDGIEDAKDSSSSSENEDSGVDEEAPAIEWLATSREKRSTAGNRMKSMIAAEEPDDELELLFAEDGDDAGFTDVDDDASDVHMESSSDDEDAQENADDDAGEKELEKQARESRQAARKRKAQEVIPVKFRKKVKINTNTSTSTPSTATPQPRPKKKSERTSWLPTPADMPTRASRRETTMLSKEQLHQQMIDREVKRLKQVEAMERRAKKMEALKKPPMTQAQRLAEAAIVEKRNAKSLNRWEEAEKQREEERRAKLAALNNRTLDGPVVTFWSGVGEWVDGKLKHVGKFVTIEEKPIKKKRASALRETAGKLNTANAEAPPPNQPEKKEQPLDGPPPALNEVEMQDSNAPEPKDPEVRPPETMTAPKTRSPEANPPEIKPSDMRLPETSQYAPSMFALPQQSQLMKAPELKPPSNSFLAPPPGVTQSGLSMPMLVYSSSTNNTSDVLAPPNTSQRQSPLSMPQTNTGPPPAPIQSAPRQDQTACTAAPPRTSSKPLGNLKATHTNAPKKQANVAEPAPPPRPSPPANGKATRNCFILQNFDENSIKEKAVQTRILFGKKMNKLGKPAHPPKCIITNKPALYKDPKTGLPYRDKDAYKEIQKLQRGDYKWSRLVGAWVGTGSCAARGVPARFLDPNAPGPVKKTELKESDDLTSTKQEEPGQAKTAPATPSTGNVQTQPATTTPVLAPPVATVPAVATTPAPAGTCTTASASVAPSSAALIPATAAAVLP
ncbi:YL1 nuclear protein-domain-containing protein [Pseudomassariella vexata]|uniref:YL1 nuclear protein-domain-containing protein n=1 Tax=Pseudomassariella vexata TaxID=1141098 RepID=A0A1Y2EDP9_9PEZI|nr:YL1 nuclear protein-domain-containing protein [Pseudomassariella vexata]ORY69537.1 YL1 nuclear protein-domain-containing protein [Pseudomassariella vexata]